MDALMAALVAALLTHASDRTPWAAARLGDQYAKPAAVIAATVLAVALGNAVGVVGGMVVAPLLPLDARNLMLALALLSGGITAFWPLKPPRMRDWRLGAFASSLLSIGLLGFGDRMQFVTATLAARSETPWLAAVGATIGAVAVDVSAIVAGERASRRVLAVPLRIAAAVLLTVAGTIQALAAIRLI